MTETFYDEHDPRGISTGELELEDRANLRRVAGFSTELEDISEAEYRQMQLEKVVLAGVWTQGTLEQAERSMRELAALAETAGAEVLEAVIQRREHPDPSTYLGSGKVEELHQIVKATRADTVICDGELSPGQLRKLEDILKVKVVDRTWLILDIFAQHARSREGKAQVALAQFQYLIPRLRGWGEALSRQAGGAGGGAGGGVGTRGPGETKIETDRRRIRDSMTKLRRELKEMEKSRVTQRAARKRAQVPAVAIAGYTNAGKSSLLNRITGAGVLVQNALFATLDPTIRKTKTPSGREFTIADTVGFVRHLPHQLVEAFRSTLDEVKDADLILHVVDGSDEAPFEQIAAVREVLNDIDAGGVPELIVINKADIADQEMINQILRREPGAVVVSAATGAGIEELLLAIEADLPQFLEEVEVVVPYSRGDLISRAHELGDVLELKHLEGGTKIHARVPKHLAFELQQARV